MHSDDAGSWSIEHFGFDDDAPLPTTPDHRTAVRPRHARRGLGRVAGAVLVVAGLFTGGVAVAATAAGQPAPTTSVRTVVPTPTLDHRLGPDQHHDGGRR